VRAADGLPTPAVNSKYGIDWYLVLGRAIYGVGFGLWYVAE
jgi:hypothetical protein